MQSLRCSLSILNMSAGNKDGIKILCCPYVCHLLFMQCKGWVLIRTGIGSKGVDVQGALNSAKPQADNNPRRKMSWLLLQRMDEEQPLFQELHPHQAPACTRAER